jgi:hypothetical protein
VTALAQAQDYENSTLQHSFRVHHSGPAAVMANIKRHVEFGNYVFSYNTLQEVMTIPHFPILGALAQLSFP